MGEPVEQHRRRHTAQRSVIDRHPAPVMRRVGVPHDAESTGRSGNRTGRLIIYLQDTIAFLIYSTLALPNKIRKRFFKRMLMKRRRGEELDSAIRSAVLDLLVEHGPGGVTMEAVAAAARTSKPVLYRRWPDRAGLLRDTLLRIATAAIPHEDTGSYRERHARDPARLGRPVHRPQRRPDARRDRRGATIPSCGRRSRTTSSAGASRRWPRCSQRHRARRRTCRVPVEIARELGQSVLWHRLLITGDPITDD